MIPSINIIFQYLSSAKFLGLGVCFFSYVSLLDTTLILAQQGEVNYTPISVYKTASSLSPSVLAELKSPQAVEIDMRGFIYLADPGVHRIFKFSSQLELLARTSGWGNEQDLLDYPFDIAVDRGLNLLIAEYYNGRIIRLDSDLNYISEINLSSGGDDFKNPISLALSAWGETFILQENTGEVLKMIPSGKSTQFGGFRPGSANLAGANHLVIDEQGQLFVSLPQEKSLIVYDRYGSYLWTLALNLPVTCFDCDEYSLYLVSDSFFYLYRDSNLSSISFTDESSPTAVKDIAVAKGIMVVLSEIAPFITVYRISNKE
jgi:hypothetical protein